MEAVSSSLPWLNTLSTPLVLLGVLLLHRYLPLPEHYHPLALLRGLATNLQKKVFPSSDRPPSQQQIASVLGATLLILPFVLILLILGGLSEYPALWQGLMLYLSLDWEHSRRRAINIAAQLEKGYKVQARESLGHLVCRKSARLSSLGILKATIESVLQRANLQLFAVLFWYVIAGGVAALTYRGIRELAMQWNPKREKFRYFGAPISAMVLVLDWLPARLLALSYALSGNLSRWAKHSLNWLGKFPNNQAGLLVSCGADALKTELGGPLYYDKHKQQRPRINQGTAPEPITIIKALSLIRNSIGFWIALLLMGYCGLLLLELLGV
ncbi:cobalamin biosynthesis protein [Corallincola platygyrae]|uniref:Cobalamin biosynthesis protein n=1 Tax=Corallincola platygyrae TaxID=1193278 RepID=A0ABW4XLI4_9GAMM